MLRKRKSYISAICLVLIGLSTNTYADATNKQNTLPHFKDYKTEQIAKLIKASDTAREVIAQKKLKQQSSKNMKNYSGYVTSPQLSKKAVKSFTMPQPKKALVNQNTFTVKNDKYNISIPTSSTGSITLNKIMPKASKKAATAMHDNYTFSVSLPNQGANTFFGKASMASDNSVVYSNYGEDTDVAVQAFKDSVRILTILNSVDSPTEYIYDINVPIDGEMKKLKNGSIMILDKNKNFKGGFLPPWAVDKNGKKVPTHFEIRDNILIQIVEHLSLNVEYPVVADPYWGYDLISSWSWDRPNKSAPYYAHDWIMTVYPTFWGRFYGGTHTAALFGWLELQEKANNYGLTENLGSMGHQYMCHAEYAFWLPRGYHLEEWRPWKPYYQYFDYLCNPPGHIDQD